MFLNLGYYNKNNKIYHGINEDTEIIECVVDRLYTRDRWGAFLLVFTGFADDGIFRCLRSAPVRAVRGPPDLVRHLALVKTRISVFMVHKI